MLNKEQELKEETENTDFWKITELKKYLLVLVKEDKLKCEVTRSEENDIKDKIKLMQEAQEFGERKAIQKTLEIIEDVDIELLFTDIQDKKQNKFEFSDELMKIIGIWWEKKSEELKSSIIGSEEK